MSAVTVIASTLGQIFQPLFQAMAWLMAFFYALVPNYAIAIALLTIVVMAITSPLTVKSTRSMLAMQKLAPELKKLQAKYKGDKQTLNEEMMKLYREHGVNPAGGCLPLLIQFPFFIILYDVIRGLGNTVKIGHLYPTYPNGTLVTCVQAHAPCASPRYIPYSTHLFGSLQQHHGQMPAFGIDLTSTVLHHHSVVAALPYVFLILLAIALQYLQMWQLNSRNPQAAQANPQMQMMQRYMPLLFAVIYINIPAGVNVYFIVSNLCRIGIQEAVFKTKFLAKPARTAEEKLPARDGAGAGRRRTLMERLADAQKRALEQQAQQRVQRGEVGGRGDRPQLGPSSPEGAGPKSGKDASASARPKQPPSASGQDREATGPRQGPAPGRQYPNGSQPKRGGQSRSRARRGRRSR